MLREKVYTSFRRVINRRRYDWPRVHQIYFAASQRLKLERAFVPFFNRKNSHPEWREYHIFRTEYYRGTCSQGITGFVSWKFRDKTGISGQQFGEWILANPGYDVYFVNPFPHELRFKSVWEQGDAYHAGLTALTQSLFDRSGHQIDLQALAMDDTTTAYCNFWVGTPGFWQKYMDFCEPLYDLIQHRVSAEERCLLFSRADKIIDSSYVPFIFERLFSTLLKTQSDIRSLRIPLERDQLVLPRERTTHLPPQVVHREPSTSTHVHTTTDRSAAMREIQPLLSTPLKANTNTFDIDPEPFHGRDQRWVVVAHWDEDRVIDDHVKYALREYRKCAAKVTLVSTACTSLPRDLEGIVDSFHFRDNHGYDFASWQHVLQAESLPEWCKQVVFVNSSVYGPVLELDPCFSRHEIAGAHLWGMSISAELERHLQSYFMVMARTLLESTAGQQLWDGIKPYEHKRQVIDAYEMRLLRHVQQSGFTVRALFDATQSRTIHPKEQIRNLLRGPQSRRRLYRRSCRATAYNPSHMYWREMLSARVPFVKVELLRDNPFGLDTTRVLGHLEHRTTYPVELIRNHLRRVGGKR